MWFGKFTRRAAICLVLAANLGSSKIPPPDLSNNHLRSITTERSGKQFVVTFNAVGDYRYEKYELQNPKRLVIDLIRLRNAVRPNRIDINSEGLQQIVVSQFRTQNPPITRVTMTMSESGRPYSVARQGSRMQVVFEPPEAQTALATPVSAEPASTPAAPLGPPARKLEAVQEPKITGASALPAVAAPPSTDVTKSSPTTSSAPSATETKSELSSPGYFGTRTMQPNPRQMRVRPRLERPFGAPPPPAEPTGEAARPETPVAPAPTPSTAEASTPAASPKTETPAELPKTPAPIEPPQAAGLPAPALPPIDQTPVLPKADALDVPVAPPKPETAIAAPDQAKAVQTPAEEPALVRKDLQASEKAPSETSLPAPSPGTPAAQPTTAATPSTSAGAEPAVAKKGTKIAISSRSANVARITPIRIATRAEKPAELSPAEATPSVVPQATESQPSTTAMARPEVSVAPPSQPESAGQAPPVVQPTPAPAAAATPVAQPVPIVMSPEAALAATLASSQAVPAKSAPATGASSSLPRSASKLPPATATPRVKPLRGGLSSAEPQTLPQTLSTQPGQRPAALPTSPVRPMQTIRTSQAGTEQTTETPEKQYTGEPIDLRVKDVDLVDFFRMMAEISGLNISIDPDVSGRITMTMGAVPWDQIFELALVTHRLEKKIEGNVVRVAKKETLQAEEGAKKSLKQAVEDATDTEFLSVKLNYADAKLLSEAIGEQLSARGKVLADERTNTVIINDVPKKLAELGELLKTLDISEPQVVIESRIVQATRNFARDIGVNFGFVAGNGQRVTVGAPPLGALQVPGLLNPNVNLSAPRRNGTAAIKVGNVLDTLILDAAISAGEQKGLAKLLSQPKVTAQNNQEAVIRQGVRFPIQIVQNNTISVQFQDASLTLKVTPQITDEDTILLTLRVENNVADFTRSVNGIPSINTSESETKVLIVNGGTTVIGGILVDEDRNTDDRVPGLASIPIFGHLFKRRSSEKRTQEVLFFVTPRIER